MIKAIVLDIGGVILRTEDPSGRLQIEKKYHLPSGGAAQLVFNSAAALASTLGTVGPNVIWQNVAEQLSLSPEALSDFKRNFWQGDIADPDLIEFLKELRKDYTTALLSNAWLHAREQFADKYGIKEGVTVDHIIISSEVGVAKPDPGIYKILSEVIGCKYKEILFVDDFEENIQAAQTLGIETIHYQPGMDLINKIKSRLNQE